VGEMGSKRDRGEKERAKRPNNNKANQQHPIFIDLKH